MKHEITAVNTLEVHKFASIPFKATIDGVEVNGYAQCRRTGRQTETCYQIYWRLVFDNPEVTKHPDYPIIRKKIFRLIGINQTANYNVRTTKDGKRITFQS